MPSQQEGLANTTPSRQREAQTLSHPIQWHSHTNSSHSIPSNLMVSATHFPPAAGFVTIPIPRGDYVATYSPDFLRSRQTGSKACARRLCVVSGWLILCDHVSHLHERFMFHLSEARLTCKLVILLSPRGELRSMIHPNPAT